VLEHSQNLSEPVYSSSIEDDISITENYYRSVSVNVTGVHFDYAFVPFKSLAILPGLGLKFGTMQLEQYFTYAMNGNIG